MSNLNLEQLLAPISLAHFFQEYWEQKPLAIQRQQQYDYSELFSSKQIESILLFSHPRYPNVQIGQADGRFSIDGEGMKTRTIHEYGTLDLNWLYQKCAAGGILFLDRIQDYSSTIAQLCRTLEQTLYAPVSATAYSVHQDALGFAPHSHPHAVLMLQLEGSEVWRVEPPPEAQSAPLEVELQPGDLLYIPRRHLHYTVSCQQSSLHLAINVKVYTWGDLIASAISTLKLSDHSLYQSLPVGFLRRSDTDSLIQAQLTSLLAQLVQSDATSAIAHLTSRLIDQMQPLADGHFAQLEQVNELTLNSAVVKRQGMMCRVFKSGAQVGIQFPGNQVFAPAQVEPILHFIAESEQFRVSALPDVLSERSKLVLVRRLIQEGLLAIVPTAQTAIVSESFFSIAR